MIAKGFIFSGKLQSGQHWNISDIKFWSAVYELKSKFEVHFWKPETVSLPILVLSDRENPDTRKWLPLQMWHRNRKFLKLRQILVLHFDSFSAIERGLKRKLGWYRMKWDRKYLTETLVVEKVQNEGEWIPDCFGMSKWVILNEFWANFPAKIPQVSTLDWVLGSASDSNLPINIDGTLTLRRPPEV